MHLHAHFNIIYNSQEKQPKWPSPKERTVKIWDMHIHINTRTHNEVLFSQKREENPAIWDNMDGPSVK